MDNIEAAKYIKDHCLGSEVYRDGTTWNDAMVTAVEVLEGKDTNVPTNSALDHIHNAVRDDAYRREYEQGKADVLCEAHWIKRYTPDDGEIYECDNCGVTWQFNDGGPEENEAYYCPKCGFKMVPKGEQN